MRNNEAHTTFSSQILKKFPTKGYNDVRTYCFLVVYCTGAPCEDPAAADHFNFYKLILVAGQLFAAAARKAQLFLARRLLRSPGWQPALQRSCGQTRNWRWAAPAACRAILLWISNQLRRDKVAETLFTSTSQLCFTEGILAFTFKIISWNMNIKGDIIRIDRRVVRLLQ